MEFDLSAYSVNEPRGSVNVCVSVEVGVVLEREVVVQYQTANQSAKGKKWVDRLYTYIRSFDSIQPLQGQIQDFSRGGAKLPDIINPRRACAERVTVVVSCVCGCVCVCVFVSVCVCVCLYVCMYVCLSEHAILAVRAIRCITRCHRGKHQICGNIKKAFSLKLSYSKVRAFFTHLGRGGHL